MAHPFQSETIGAISEALSKAQGKMRNPTKNALNSHFKNSYSTLDEGINAVREPLSSHGIAFTQVDYMIGNLLMLETKLSHSSGEWLSSHSPIINIPCKPQELMMAKTYARRGALFAMVGISGEEDDDGNVANKSIIEPAKDPKRPNIDATASSALLDTMLASLTACQTEEELTVWTLSNKASKANLTLADQAIITRTYKQVMADIKEKNNG